MQPRSILTHARIAGVLASAVVSPEGETLLVFASGYNVVRTIHRTTSSADASSSYLYATAKQGGVAAPPPSSLQTRDI